MDEGFPLLLKRWVPCSLPSEWQRCPTEKMKEKYGCGTEDWTVKLHDFDVALTSECWKTQKLKTIGYFSWAGFATYVKICEKKLWRKRRDIKS